MIKHAGIASAIGGGGRSVYVGSCGLEELTSLCWEWEAGRAAGKEAALVYVRSAWGNRLCKAAFGSSRTSSSSRRNSGCGARHMVRYVSRKGSQLDQRVREKYLPL